MERWHNRIAVVTGAAGGIGSACCIELIKNGMIVVGLDINEIDLGTKLKLDHEKKRLHSIKCDLRKEEEICRVFVDIEKNIGPVAVLINNAGIVRDTELLNENNSKDLRDSLDINVMAVALCTREAFKSMKKNGGDGHVVLINSIIGHYVMFNSKYSFNMYAVTKHGITAMTEVLRQEFQLFDTKCKVTSISPGAVNTDIFTKTMRDDMDGIAFLQPEDIANAIIYCLKTPPHVQIHELTIKAVGELF